MDREISKEVQRKEQRKQFIRIGTAVGGFIVLIVVVISMLQTSLKRKDLNISTVDRGVIEVSVSASGKVIPAERPGLFLNDLLEKKNFSDFRKAFSLNDRFRFRRELFGGDEARMNKVINDLNDLHSYEDSVTYLNNELKWNIEDEAVADFIKLLEKRFL